MEQVTLIKEIEDTYKGIADIDKDIMNIVEKTKYFNSLEDSEQRYYKERFANALKAFNEANNIDMVGNSVKTMQDIAMPLLKKSMNLAI